MRPSLRLLVLAVLATGLTALALPVAQWLMALPWLVLGGAALADLLASRAIPLAVRLEGLAMLFTSQTRQATLHFNTSTPEGLTIIFDWPKGLTGPDRLDVETGVKSVALDVFGKARGEWTVEQVYAAWSSRWSLWRFTPRLPVNLTIPVVPDIRPALSGEIDLQVHASLDGQKDNKRKDIDISKFQREE